MNQNSLERVPGVRWNVGTNKTPRLSKSMQTGITKSHGTYPGAGLAPLFTCKLGLRQRPCSPITVKSGKYFPPRSQSNGNYLVGIETNPGPINRVTLIKLAVVYCLVRWLQRVLSRSVRRSARFMGNGNGYLVSVEENPGPKNPDNPKSKGKKGGRFDKNRVLTTALLDSLSRVQAIQDVQQKATQHSNDISDSHTLVSASKVLKEMLAEEALADHIRSLESVATKIPGINNPHMWCRDFEVLAYRRNDLFRAFAKGRPYLLVPPNGQLSNVGEVEKVPFTILPVASLPKENWNDYCHVNSIAYNNTVGSLINPWYDHYERIQSVELCYIYLGCLATSSLRPWRDIEGPVRDDTVLGFQPVIRYTDIDGTMWFADSLVEKSQDTSKLSFDFSLFGKLGQLTGVLSTPHSSTRDCYFNRIKVDSPVTIPGHFQSVENPMEIQFISCYLFNELMNRRTQLPPKLDASIMVERICRFASEDNCTSAQLEVSLQKLVKPLHMTVSLIAALCTGDMSTPLPLF